MFSLFKWFIRQLRAHAILGLIRRTLPPDEPKVSTPMAGRRLVTALPSCSLKSSWCCAFCTASSRCATAAETCTPVAASMVTKPRPNAVFEPSAFWKTSAPSHPEAMYQENITAQLIASTTKSTTQTGSTIFKFPPQEWDFINAHRIR